MARDRQIFVRTTQEAYDWVAVQAEALGLKHGALVSEVLEMAARQGWVLEGPRLAAGPNVRSDTQRLHQDEERHPVPGREPVAPKRGARRDGGPGKVPHRCPVKGWCGVCQEQKGGGKR